MDARIGCILIEGSLEGSLHFFLTLEFFVFHDEVDQCISSTLKTYCDGKIEYYLSQLPFGEKDTDFINDYVLPSFQNIAIIPAEVGQDSIAVANGDFCCIVIPITFHATAFL